MQALWKHTERETDARPMRDDVVISREYCTVSLL